MKSLTDELRNEELYNSFKISINFLENLKKIDKKNEEIIDNNLTYSYIFLYNYRKDLKNKIKYFIKKNKW